MEVDEKSYRIKNHAYTEDGLIINSKFLNGLTVEAAKHKIIDGDNGVYELIYNPMGNPYD